VGLTIAVVVVVWYIVIELFLKGFFMARGSRNRKGSVGKRPGGKRHVSPQATPVKPVSQVLHLVTSVVPGGRVRRARAYNRKRYTR